jgi:hypothetical protein
MQRPSLNVANSENFKLRQTLQLTFPDLEEPIRKFKAKAKCYKTFYGRNLRKTVIIESFCPLHAFPVLCNVYYANY